MKVLELVNYRKLPHLCCFVCICCKSFRKCIMQCWTVVCRSCVGGEQAADDSCTRDSDPCTSAVDCIITSTRLWTLSSSADDDVQPAWAEPRVPKDVHVYSRPVRYYGQPAEWSFGDPRLDVMMHAGRSRLPHGTSEHTDGMIMGEL